MGAACSAWAGAGGLAVASVILYLLYFKTTRQMSSPRHGSPVRGASPARTAPASAPAPAPPPGPAPAPCYVITLNHGEHHDSTLHKYDKGTRIRFAAGTSLLGKKVLFFTNYTFGDLEGEKLEAAEFVRSQYVCLGWQRVVRDGAAWDRLARGGAPWDEDVRAVPSAVLADTEHFCELTLRRAGTFHYYFLYDTAGVGEEARPAGSGWVGVAGGGAGLCALTVLAKGLGPLSRWRAALQPAHYAGYNMIHITPIQELGASRSCYSIANQLRLDPRLACPDLPAPTFQDVEDLLQSLRTEWQMRSICDVVLNHTANETAWLREQPAATYNCRSAPHLRAAALLDAALLRLRTAVTHIAHLQALREEAWRGAEALRLHELVTCDAGALLAAYRARAERRVPAPPPPPGAPPAQDELRLLPDGLRRRLRATVDLELAVHLYHRYRAGEEEKGATKEGEVLARGAAQFRAALDALNEAATRDLHGHLCHAIDNVIAHVTYERLAEDGPKVREVSEKHPLVTPYFTWPGGSWATTAAAEETVFGEGGALVQAHNGWVMGADPLQDFALANDGLVYLRRELVCWGDSVKLRYGACPEDNPWLWAHMRSYVELTAELFDGLRLDNCHSTPLHVAEYMMDCARNVKPDLFVVAELFTDSDAVDNIYVNRLGIDALVREGMSAWDAAELGRLVYRYGGRPVGAVGGRAGGCSWEWGVLGSPAAPQVAAAMLLDLTHDNVSPLQRRPPWDVLASAAAVAAAACAVGSTRGLDELVPHQIHVVSEERLYARWGEGAAEGEVCARAGVLRARRELSLLHAALATHYTEVFVDQMDDSVIVVTRHNPETRESVIVVCCTMFEGGAGRGGGSPPPARPPKRPLRVEGRVERVLLDAEMVYDHTEGKEEFVRDPKYINGLRGWHGAVRVGAGGQLGAGGAVGGAGGGAADDVAQCDAFSRVTRTDTHTELQWGALRPGRVLALKVSLCEAAAAALADTRRALAAPPDFTDLSLLELNALLYRCEGEERAASGGARGLYCLPGHGDLVYAGLRGAASVILEMWARQDLGHPLADNLRAGDWLLDYTVDRLEGHPAQVRVAAALRPLRGLPRYLQPRYAGAALLALCARAEAAALAQLQAPPPPALGAALALTSVQLVGRVRGAALPAAEGAGSLSAGLPHFAHGYMRCWGRDTFIALPGLLLHTGRHQDALRHIIGFGACLRHGLIPNLLDRGVKPRYNCRDAVWWWLYAIRRYCEITGSYSILSEAVPRIYPTDAAPAPAADGDAAPALTDAPRQPLHDVMQEALDRHFQGIVFRESGAGPDVDAHMTDQGFNVQIGIDPETGFPFGGNQWNCGTWMDKMGSSVAAGTRGTPATPRDGSAVELVALAYGAARWLHAAHASRRYPHPGVARTDCPAAAAAAWTWAEWADRIKAHFERAFWVGARDGPHARPDLVHRTHIYKDTHNATHAFTEYQLRCNYSVAMAVAPDLFDAKHAALALDTAERLLVGELGMKTLDPEDWAYRPDYDNDNRSSDPALADGFNYHQGPEWVWPLGMFLRARLLLGGARAAANVRRRLGAMHAALVAGAERGVPELYDAGGATCRFSCTTQAWSSALYLEVLKELEALEQCRQLSAD